jgi:hypothetical protein
MTPVPLERQAEPDAAGIRQLDRFRATLCGSTFLMVALSWPLWVDGGEFPRVPFVGAMPALPVWVSWAVLLGIEVSLVLAAFGWRWRAMLSVGCVLLTFAILPDQNRFQPWAYQFAVAALLMACLPGSEALRLARWYVIGLYVYSSLSKLDASFCLELGPTFLSAILRPLGVDPWGWTQGPRNAATLAMPLFELVVAALLVLPSTRRWGVLGSILIHASLVGVLGPWGLDHSTIVLIWNVALAVEVMVLFWSVESPRPKIRAGGMGLLVRALFEVLMVLPAGERLGWCDAWPAHALYASHAERSDIFIHEDESDRYPAEINRWLGPTGVGGWRRLDVTGWSRSLRGTPPYPSGRIGNAIAEFLEVRFAGPQPVRLVQWGRAGVWDGARPRDESLGLKAIRRRAGEFWINARPAGASR